MTERGSGLPSPQQVIGLLEGEFARLGYEVDSVEIDDRTRPARIRVVADGDRPPDLDAIAELSRTSSVLLDTLDTAAAPYVLEVTSPGVDRPLRSEKHFRRARGRTVAATLTDRTTVTGRIAGAVDGAVDLVVRDGGTLAVRRVPIADIADAVVQVEFSPPSPEELALVAARSGDSGPPGDPGRTGQSGGDSGREPGR